MLPSMGEGSDKTLSDPLKKALGLLAVRHNAAIALIILWGNRECAITTEEGFESKELFGGKSTHQSRHLLVFALTAFKGHSEAPYNTVDLQV